MDFCFLSPRGLNLEETHSGRVSLDFNDVELSVFVRFISELTGKNFVLDDVVKKAGGKISVYSPTKVTHDQAYSMFVAALEVSRLAVVTKGNVHQIVAMGDLPPERGAFVYKLKHANATDLAAILTNLVARSQTVAQTAPGTRPLFRPLSEFEAPVQVFADKATNSIIISSTKSAYTKLQSVIRDLDTRRKQVFVEAVILEVEVDRLRQIGTDPVTLVGAGKSGAFAGIGGFNTAPENLSTIAKAIIGDAVTGGAVSVLNTVNLRAFMQLLMSLTDTNILSTPQVLAADNQKAKIVVGENRPFPTGQAQGNHGRYPRHDRAKGCRRHTGNHPAGLGERSDTARNQAGDHCDCGECRANDRGRNFIGPRRPHHDQTVDGDDHRRKRRTDDRYRWTRAG